MQRFQNPRVWIPTLLLVGGAIVGVVWVASIEYGSKYESGVDLRSAYGRSDMNAVIAEADRRIAISANDVESILAKATALAQKGSLEFKEDEYGPLAIALARHALTIEPRSSDAWRIIGYGYEIQEQYDEAHAAYAQAITIDPTNVAAISQDAHAWDLQGNTERALAGYRQALALNAQYVQAIVGEGRLYVRAGELERALSSFRFALQILSSAEIPNIRLAAEAAASAASIAATMGDLPEAERLARQAVDLDPSYALGWAGLGAVIFMDSVAPSEERSDVQRKVRIDDSFESLEKAIEINPNLTVAHLQLGLQFAAFGRTADALIVLGGVPEISERDITLSADEKASIRQRADVAIAVVQNKL